MEKEQWAVRVSKKQGEETRQKLQAEKLLDRTLKIEVQQDDILIPVLVQLPESMKYHFTVIRQQDALQRHELIGGIAIIQENDAHGAAQILASRPSVHTVLYATSTVTGRYRTREFLVLAGTDTTRTEYTEYQMNFTIDLAAAYFSARLANERQRIRMAMQDKEQVLDMFAGVGPFSIALANRASIIYACDINPAAVLLMEKNIRKNRVRTIIPVLADTMILPHILKPCFDRIIMNLPLSGSEFLPVAFSLCRPGGIIHWYVLVSRTGEHLQKIHEMGASFVQERQVRSYSSDRFHTVYDITKG